MAAVRVTGVHQGTVKRIDLPRHPGDKVRDGDTIASEPP